METPNCSIHGNQMMLKPAGISKTTGKPYEAFWTCPTRGTDGSYCKAKPTMASHQIPTVQVDSPSNTVLDEINFKLQLIADTLKKQHGYTEDEPTE